MKPWVTYGLVLLNALLFAFGFSWPLQGLDLGVILYSFSHAGWLHLAFNLTALVSFGALIERTHGSFALFRCYFASVLAGAALHLIANDPGMVVGSSGGIFGLMMFFWLMKKRYLIATAVVLLSLALAVFKLLPMMAHFVHLGGLVAGFWIFAILHLKGERARLSNPRWR